MYKLIRLFAPVVLALYVSTMVVGNCWGEEKPTVNVVDWYDTGGVMVTPLETGKLFKVKVQAYYKNQALKDIKITSSDGFKILNSWIENNIFDKKTSDTVFELESPSKSGKYMVTFEGVDIDGKTVAFVHEIEVINSSPIVDVLVICLGIVLILALGSVFQRASSGG